MNPIRSFKGIMPLIDNSVFIDESAVVTGQVTLHKDSSVWPHVSIRGDLLPIEIGSRSNVQDGSVIHTTEFKHARGTGFDVKVGKDVTIGHRAVLHGCHIGNRVLVGMGAIVLDGAVVEDDVMIGAGSLVPPNKRLVSGYLYIGSPVKQARPLTEEEKQMILTNAQSYVEVKNEHKTLA